MTMTSKAGAEDNAVTWCIATTYPVCTAVFVILATPARKAACACVCFESLH